MTMNDAFDQRLRAAFADAAAPLGTRAEADAFARRVVARLSKPDHSRAWILGAAGLAGSIIAGSQLGPLMTHLQLPTDGLLASAAFLLAPETLTGFAMAVALAMVALILPRRII